MRAYLLTEIETKHIAFDLRRGSIGVAVGSRASQRTALAARPEIADQIWRAGSDQIALA